MSDPSGDRFAAAARYLATGDPTGLPGDGTRHRLDRALAVLAERSTWEQPAPGLRAAVVDRIDQIERFEPFDRIDWFEWDGDVDRLRAAEPLQREHETLRPRTARRAHPTRRRPPTRRTTRRLVTGVAAAVLALAGVALAGVLRSSAPDTEDRTEGRTGSLAGGRTEAKLAGTDLAPGARAVATLRPTPSGSEVTLRIVGLDPAPPGTYYQAWMKGPRGAVPLGTFHVRGGDGESIELWSGVDPAAYPEITVTLEPEDGDPASSGRKVLESKVHTDQVTGTSGSGT